MFDTVCKFLVETFSIDFATWLLGKPVTLTELSPSELSLEPIRADALILLQSEETILHLEFQSRPDEDMGLSHGRLSITSVSTLSSKINATGGHLLKTLTI